MTTPADDHMSPTTRARRRVPRFRVPARGPVFGSLASAAFGQVALVVTGVLAARALGPADRGYLALVILIPAVLQGVGNLGLPRAVTYFIASNPAQSRSIVNVIRRPVVIQAISLTILQAAILAVIVAVEPPDVRWAAVAVLPLLAANLAETYGKAILLGQQRYLAFNIVRNVGLTLYLVGLVVVVAAGHAGLIEFAVTYVIANIVAAVVTIVLAVAGRPKDTASANVTQGMLLRFGLKGYIASLSPIAAFRLDQVVVGLLLSPAALGLYVVGLAFTNLPGFISRSVGFIAFPKVAGAASEQKEEMQRFFGFTIALSGAAVIVLEVTAGWLVPLFFGSEFEGAVPLARILLITAFFDGARQILADTASGRGRPGLGSIAEVTAWIVLVPAVAILLPLWDDIGVAAATAAAAVASFSVLAVLVRYTESGRAANPAALREQA